MASALFRRVPAVSAHRVERSLAGLLIALLGTYAIGSVANGVVPPLHATGVVAVHVAVVVACAFPLVLLGHAAVGTVRADGTTPELAEVAAALVALGSLVAALWLAMESADQTVVRLCFGVAVGGLLVLAGLVLGGRR